MLEELNRIRYIYHYTSLDTLLAILENYRKDKEKNGLIFRASNIYMVNDPKEMEVGYGIVKEYLKEYETTYIPKPYWLHEIANSNEYEAICKNNYFVGYKGFLTEPVIIPFIISFSAKRDYLPMWSLYGKTGLGVCLKFDAFRIIEAEYDGQIGFVAYDNKTGLKMMKESFSECYNWYLYEYKDKLDLLTIDKKVHEIGNLCLYMSPFIKYRDYKYEKEFRLTCYKHYGDDIINTLSLNEFINPKIYPVDKYIEVPIPVSSFKEVMLGPNMDKSIMAHIVKKELEECNIRVRVSESKISFRLK